MTTASPWKRQLRPVVLLLFGTLLLLALFGGENNLLSLWKLHRQRQALLEEVERLRVDNQLLADQIRALREDPSAIEKVAREHLGMSAPGETIYRILPAAGRDSVADSVSEGN